MIALECARGKAVLCGDIAYTLKNIRDHHPVGWYYDLCDTVAALDRAIATAARPDLAFPITIRRSCREKESRASFESLGFRIGAPVADVGTAFLRLEIFFDFAERIDHQSLPGGDQLVEAHGVGKRKVPPHLHGDFGT